MQSAEITVVSAEGAVLDTILDACYPLWGDGLSRAAYGRSYTAQLKTP